MPHAINNSHLLSWFKFNVLDEAPSLCQLARFPSLSLPVRRRMWHSGQMFAKERPGTCFDRRLLAVLCGLRQGRAKTKRQALLDGAEGVLGGLENIWSVDYRLL